MFLTSILRIFFCLISLFEQKTSFDLIWGNFLNTWHEYSQYGYSLVYMCHNVSLQSLYHHPFIAFYDLFQVSWYSHITSKFPFYFWDSIKFVTSIIIVWINPLVFTFFPSWLKKQAHLCLYKFGYRVIQFTTQISRM